MSSPELPPSQPSQPSQPSPASSPLTPDQPAPRASRASTGVAVGAAVAIAALGAVIGGYESLQAVRLIALGPLHISVGALAAGPINAGLGVLAAWALRSRDAAVLPGLGWFVAIVVMLIGPRPGGDIVLPGSGGAVTAYAVVGFVGIGLAALLATRVAPPRPARGQSSTSRGGASPSASARR